MISGWSDWVASLQIISKNLQDIGIDASVKLEPDWGSWYPNATSTKFVTLLWQIAATGSPYGYFFNNMHNNTYVPSGEDAVNTGNFAHYKNAAGDDPARQVEGDARRRRAEEDRNAGPEALAEGAADHPAVRRYAVVDLQHEVLPLLPDSEQPVCASDLQQLPGQRSHADPHLHRRRGTERAPSRKSLPRAVGRGLSTPPNGTLRGDNPAMRFILRRLGFYAIALWGAITLNFLLPRLMPGSPLDGLMSRLSPSQLAANPHMVENLREYLNVQEEPFFQAYWTLPRADLHR